MFRTVLPVSATQVCLASAACVVLLERLVAPKSPQGSLPLALTGIGLTVSGISTMYALATLQGGVGSSRSTFAGCSLLCSTERSRGDLARLRGDPPGNDHRVGWRERCNGRGRLGRDLDPPEKEISSLRAPDRRSLVGFGLRGFLGTAPPMEAFRLDQIIVGFALSPVALGYYVAALAFTSLTRFLGDSIGYVAFPTVAGAPPGQRQSQARHYALLALALCGIRPFY